MLILLENLQLKSKFIYLQFFGIRYNYKIGSEKNLSKLEKRMTNRVTRDIDIITNSEGISPIQQVSLSADVRGEELRIAFVDLSKEDDGDIDLMPNQINVKSDKLGLFKRMKMTDPIFF